jgi:hypothetical protein
MWSGVGSSTHSQPEPGRQLREGIRGVDSSKIRLNRPPLNQGVARERGNTSERKFRYGGPSRCSGLAACFCVVFHSSSLLRHSPLPHFVNLCPTCDSSKKHEQNYIQVHDSPPIFPTRSFRDAARPNHFLIRSWPFAVFARKSALQAFRQKRRPQWLWQTRPNFPPQVAQRFSNLVMKLSADFDFCTTNGLVWLTRRVQGFPEARSDYVSQAAPEACFAPPIPCYFGPTDCLPQSSRAWSWKWSDA